MIVAPSDKVKISEHVLSQEVGGETVLLDLKGEYYFGLDEIGTRIWQLFQSESSIQNLIEKMLNEFEVDSETLEADVKELLAKLLDAKLVSIEPALK